MNKILTYIEKTLHLSANISVYDKASELPLYLRNGYDLYILYIQNVKCLLVCPKEQTNLTDMRKQANQLMKITGLDVALCLDDMRVYTREKMLSEGIPFIIAGKQIYMPFLGFALSNKNTREIPHTNKLSFVAQKLLLSAIYQGWKETTVTEAANILGLSKMTITRSFDELHSVGLDLIKSNSKTRCFSWTDSRRALWDIVMPFLRNPVAQQYRLGERIEVEDYKLGGISALCHYSMLTDNPYTIYSVGKDTAKALELNKLMEIPTAESPLMVIQVMRYDIDYHDRTAVDPLTAILSLTNNEKSDPRVETAIEDVLEEHLHD